MTYPVKRCPFCNGHELTIDWSGIEGVYSNVRCKECGAMGPTSKQDYFAVKLWNGEHRNQNTSAMVAEETSSNRNDKKEVDL